MVKQLTNSLSIKLVEAVDRLRSMAYEETTARPDRVASWRSLPILGLKALFVAHARVRMTIGSEPLSYAWGYGRGTQIHRDYVEVFLGENSDLIRGQCLEFKDRNYTVRFGGSRVGVSDILHVDDTNSDANIVADLTEHNSIPSDTYDCIICTHVLHIVFEMQAIVREMRRILRPGGALLVAVPASSMNGLGGDELWRITKEGLTMLLRTAFEPENVLVKGYGNSLLAAGELRGLVKQEFSRAELDFYDPHYPIEVCGRAIKSSAL
ncbi:MAG: class I SAM-dependent methyltransferase [Gammaproteobacteria bacterium]